jgi:hypothetical protein
MARSRKLSELRPDPAFHSDSDCREGTGPEGESLESVVSVAVEPPGTVNLRIQPDVDRASVGGNVCYRLGSRVQNGRGIDIRGAS